jgi:hypothetical protein
MDLLSQILGEQFEDLPLEPVVGDGGQRSGILTWDDVNNALNSPGLYWPRFRLVKNGEAVSPNQYTRAVDVGDHRLLAPDAVRLQTILSSGSTLIVDSVEPYCKALLRFIQDFENECGCDVWANLYCSFGSAPGFGLHWDDHDVLVLQIHGEKRWHVLKPERLWPMGRDIEQSDPPRLDEAIQYELAPGMALFLPRGWWHMAATQGTEPSLHLTVGIRRPAFFDLVSWVVDRLLGDERMRMPIAAHSNDRQNVQRDLADLLHRALTDTEALPQYLEFLRASKEGSGFSLPLIDASMPWAGQELEVRLTTRRWASEVDDSRAEMIFAAGGQSWTLDSRTQGLLAPLLDRNWITMTSLIEGSGLHPNDVEEVLKAMWEAGVVSIRLPTEHAHH